MPTKYQPQEFEKKWIENWEKEKTYKTPEKPKKNKKYILDMFPYPSGAGLHVGHPRGYVASDIIARYFRQAGYDVLHPMGWDAFGLPAENAAIKAKKNPIDMVPLNIATFKRQMKMLGLSYDWGRELATTDPNYYKWTQWIFIQFYKMGLLYKKNTPINFCPVCKTGLAEEEVLPNGTHERCGNKIEKKELPQWLFAITKYADRLLTDLKQLDWPKGILEMQKNWIGRSEGAKIEFRMENGEERIEVFSTALDTIFGVTFMVLAPEHPLAKKIKNTDVRKYLEQTQSKSEMEREAEGKEKTGVFTGLYCINPFNNKKVPVWVADYVLPSYGTGAVMGVPGHDRRDYEFAKKYRLPIIPVIKTTLNAAVLKVVKDDFWNYEEIKTQYAEKSELINSGEYNGMNSKIAKEAMMRFIEKKGIGERTVQYHLRDWIFSRQRYWGEPIPMIHCAKDGWQPVPEDQLPVKLPYVKSYQPTGTGESPLSAIKDWVNTTCPKCGGPAKRETDTMPNWAGSCWYFIAFSFWNQNSGDSATPFVSARESHREKLTRDAVPSEAEKMAFASLPPSIENWKLKIENSGNRWLPVDWYIGGAEHAVLHLLYSRFWVKALYDKKLLNFTEPFIKLNNQGMILAEDHRKMSKSFGNVINPDDVVAEYGADSLRLYEMFMAPFNAEISWSTKALQGVYRFLKRVWGMYQQYNVIARIRQLAETKQSNSIKSGDRSPRPSGARDDKLVAKLNKTIAKVTQDIPETKFNTAIAAMMEFLNEWENNYLSKENAKKFLQILAPFAPFTTEEIWYEVYGEKGSIHLSAWPEIRKIETIVHEILIPVQVNGKVRSTISIEYEVLSIKEKVIEKALQDEKVKKYTEGKEYKVIYVPGKILNFVLAPKQ